MLFLTLVQENYIHLNHKEISILNHIIIGRRSPTGRAIRYIFPFGKDATTIPNASLSKNKHGKTNTKTELLNYPI